MKCGRSIRLLAVGLVFVGVPFPDRGIAQGQAPDSKHSEATPTGSPEALFKRLSPSVFVVETLDEKGSVAAIGSGVVVGPGQVVTNKHVIEGGVAWRIRRGRATWPATPSHVDPDHDLCQLKANVLRAPAVSIRASSTLTVGEHVYAIGAPEGLELTLSEGLISGLREFQHARLIQTSAAISPGSSGGGLFDAQGRLVGVTTFFLRQGQNLNFALPGEWVRGVAAQKASAIGEPGTESPTFQAAQWFVLGEQAHEAGEYDRAVKAYGEAIRLRPDLEDAWNNLGAAYEYSGQYEQAVRALREAIRLKPDYAEAWYNLGIAYGHSGQYEQAVRAGQEGIRLKPDYAEAWNSLGFAYDHSGQYEQAVRAGQEAIRLKPDLAEAWNNLGVAYGHSGQDEQAVRALREAIRLKPDYAKAWYNLGITYGLQGDRSKVMQVYEELKTLEPTLADKFFQEVVLR